MARHLPLQRNARQVDRLGAGYLRSGTPILVAALIAPPRRPLFLGLYQAADTVGLGWLALATIALRRDISACTRPGRIPAGQQGRNVPPSCTIWGMSEMPISDARERLGEVVGRARYGGEETILTHYGQPAAVVISFEEYQRLKHARDDADGGEYQLPAEITAQISEARQHPERRQPRPRRASRTQR